MWVEEDGNDAYVIYTDEVKKTVEEIGFRVDARSAHTNFVHQICEFANRLGCVLITANYEVLLPNESMVLGAINRSTAKRFVDDPVSTLRDLGAKRQIR